MATAGTDTAGEISVWRTHPMLFRFHPPDSFEGDFRDNTLQVEPELVEVHHVDWVVFDCSAHKVTRHRRGKRQPKS